jgi:hypothetical protein
MEGTGGGWMDGWMDGWKWMDGEMGNERDMKEKRMERSGVRERFEAVEFWIHICWV